MKAERDEIEPHGSREWRGWLAGHHGSASGVWLILHKKRSGRQTLSVDQAVQEALCFGWIDSQLRPIDDETSALLFTLRKRGSTWSRRNKQYVESLTATGRMTEAGREVIERAKRDGSWNKLDSIDELRVPEDLEQAFAACPRARRNFDELSPSARRLALWSVLSARRPDRRAKRIADVVRRAASAGRPAHQVARTRQPPTTNAPVEHVNTVLVPLDGTPGGAPATTPLGWP